MVNVRHTPASARTPCTCAVQLTWILRSSKPRMVTMGTRDTSSLGSTPDGRPVLLLPLLLLLMLLLPGMVLLAGGMVAGPEVAAGVVLLGLPLLPLGAVALGAGGAEVLLPTSTFGLPNPNAAQPSMSALPLT